MIIVMVMFTAALMIFSMMIMVITCNICRSQFTFQVCFNSLVCITLCTGTYSDSCIHQGILSTGTHTATDQYINILLCKQTCQSTVANAV